MLVGDAREPAHRKKLCDSVRLLEYGDRHFSTDYLILREWDPKSIVVELKLWKDLEQTSFDGSRLERQLGAVDLLIVVAPSRKEVDGWDVNDVQRALSVHKHLTRIALAMPVIIAASDLHAIETMRYLEKKPDLTLREKRVVNKTEDFLADCLSILGISPGRVTPTGTVRDDIAALPEAQAVLQSVESLIGRLADIKGVGPKTIERARARISNGL